jgi:hypothetical protein
VRLQHFLPYLVVLLREFTVDIFCFKQKSTYEWSKNFGSGRMNAHEIFDEINHDLVLYQDYLPLAMNLPNVFNVVEFRLWDQVLHRVVVNVFIFLIEQLVFWTQNMMIVFFSVLLVNITWVELSKKILDFGPYWVNKCLHAPYSSSCILNISFLKMYWRTLTWKRMHATNPRLNDRKL